MTVTEPAPATSPAKTAERWTAQWKELYAEGITTGLSTRPAARAVRAAAPRHITRENRGAMDCAVEGALRGGHHDRPLHRLRRLRRHLPARRDPLRGPGGDEAPRPPRGRARGRQ